MKKTILKTAAILLILSGGMISCGKEEIEFQEYYLPENCYIKNDFGTNPIIIIRTDEELNNYTECYYGAIAPHIDFEKNSLVCAAGSSGYHVKSITKRIMQNSNNQYILEVYIYLLSTLNEAGSWAVTVLVPKLPANAEFKLATREIF
jgi:hypothetical protein